MKGLREKFRNNKGFTLIEMLIVVAIIAILIAVSIPLVGNALEKARDATDQANERAAKAEAAIVYLGVNDGSFTTKTGTFYYDAVNGKLLDGSVAADKTSAQGLKAYGKCTNGGSHYNTAGTDDGIDHTKAIIKVVIADTGDITISWVLPSSITQSY